MMGLSAMSNVTPCPTAGDRVIHSVKGVVTSDISDAVCRTVQLYLYQPTQGEVMYECWLDLVKRYLITHLHNFIIHSSSFYFSPTHTHLTVDCIRIQSLVCVSHVTYSVLEGAPMERYEYQLPWKNNMDDYLLESKKAYVIEALKLESDTMHPMWQEMFLRTQMH